MNKKKFSIKRLILTIAIIIGILFSICMIYLSSDVYKAEAEMDEYLKSSENIEVSKINEGYFFNGPGEDIAIIFYPGAKVEYKAYAKLMYKIAENGKDCFLVEMPFNMAILGKNKADKIIKRYDYDKWFMSGHSLGGVMASAYAASNSDKIDGIIALAAYPNKKIPDNIDYISIYGSEDKVLNKDSYNKARKYLPSTSDEYVIDGGNHSCFANYGKQKGDGESKISEEEQKNLVLEIIDNIDLRED